MSAHSADVGAPRSTAGELEADRRGGAGRSSRYRLTLPLSPDRKNTGTDEDIHGTSVPNRRHNGAGETKLNHTCPKCQEIYAAYPRRVARTAAIQAIAAALKICAFADLLRSTLAYA